MMGQLKHPDDFSGSECCRMATVNKVETIFQCASLYYIYKSRSIGARSPCKRWLLKAVSSTELQIGATAKRNYWRLNVTGSLVEERSRVLRSARSFHG